MFFAVNQHVVKFTMLDRSPSFANATVGLAGALSGKTHHEPWVLIYDVPVQTATECCYHTPRTDRMNVRRFSYTCSTTAPMPIALSVVLDV